MTPARDTCGRLCVVRCARLVRVASELKRHEWPLSAMPAKMNTLSMAHRPIARNSSRGFTLIELMVVVVITGILAVAGVSLFRQQLLASKGSEAASVIQAIRAAEEAYAAENHVYLNVSTDSGGTSWYPNLTPNTTRYAW